MFVTVGVQILSVFLALSSAQENGAKPQTIGALSGTHNVKSGPIVILDDKTFQIPDFYYDGKAPDAFFWVGEGTPSNKGSKVPDENDSTEPLKEYSGQTIEIMLPDDITVHDIDYLSVWCKAYEINFAHVEIPEDLNVPVCEDEP